jgi:hypothetical protein
MSGAPKNARPLPGLGKVTQADRDNTSISGLPPIESLGKDLHAAGAEGMDGQFRTVNFASAALRSRFPPKGGWFCDEGSEAGAPDGAAKSKGPGPSM